MKTKTGGRKLASIAKTHWAAYAVTALNGNHSLEAAIRGHIDAIFPPDDSTKMLFQLTTAKGNKSVKTTRNIIYSTVALLALSCFALSPQARATCQEGCDINLQNTFLGDEALANDGGGGNTAIGALALVSPDGVAFNNTAIGAIALRFNTTGSYNTAVGVDALTFNTTGSFNTATGDGALVYNTTGDYNTATGEMVLFSNTTGENRQKVSAQLELSKPIPRNIANNP